MEEQLYSNTACSLEYEYTIQKSWLNARDLHLSQTSARQADPDSTRLSGKVTDPREIATVLFFSWNNVFSELV